MAKHLDTTRPVDAMPWRDPRADTTPTQPIPVVRPIRPVAPRVVDVWSGNPDTDRAWR